MKSGALLILIFLFTTVKAAGNQDETFTPGSRIITGEMIRQAGITRIGEILLLVDEWSISTTDGLTWMASPNGLAPFQSQTWAVMLDGQKIELNTLGVKHLYMLPVALDQISYIEVISLPQLYEGEFTDRGFIHIHTGKAELGLSLRGALVLGNETKDAGPYGYTKYATQNVDRNANDGSVIIDYGSKNWNTSASLVVQKHPFSDWAMLKRNSAIIAGWPGLNNSISPSFRFGLNFLQSKHEFLAGYSNSSKYFLFVKPLGREIPVKNAFPLIGVRGAFPASRTIGLSYRLRYSTSQIDKYPNTLDIDFDWKTQQLNANLEGDFKGNTYRAKLGVGFDRYALDSSFLPQRTSYDISKIYSQLSLRLSETTRQSISTFAALSNGKVALKTALVNAWEISPGNAFVASLSYAQRLFEEDNSFWYWAERGYTLPAPNNIDYSIFGQINKSSLLSGDIIWKTSFEADVVMEASCYYRLFNNQYLERQSFQFSPQNCLFYSPVQIHGGRNGEIVGGKLTIEHHPGAQISQRFYYSYQTEISGDGIFKGAWQTVPKHKISYQVTYLPVKNFSIWAMLSYLSASTWADYQNISNESCYLSSNVALVYSSEVRTAAVLDMKFQKWFWRRRFIGSLLLRNVLDNNYRYHPIGASFDLSLFVQVKFLFNSTSSATNNI